MPPVSPVRLLTNTPVPPPSTVLLFAVVGEGLVVQHTPLAITVAPQSDITFPPLVAEFIITLLTDVVVRNGVEGDEEVENDC